MKELKVIKVGGNLLDDAAALEIFLQDFASIKTPKILIHGGGVIASQLLQQLGIPVKMLEGRRITDQQTLDILVMTYAGSINKKLTASLQALDCNAIGLTGADGNCITAVKRNVKPIDYGFVGDPITINTQTITTLLDSGLVPIFSAITHDAAGQLLNTNADTVAAVLSAAFAKAYHTQLYYCFEKQGVLQDINDNNSLITRINHESYVELQQRGIIANGMLPKLHNCFHALNHGVASVHLGLPIMIHNNTPHTTVTL